MGVCGTALDRPIYYAVRITDALVGPHAVELVRMFINEERAHSLEYRLENEDLLIAKALQRPIFGWGGWGRNCVYDGDRQAAYHHRREVDHRSGTVRIRRSGLDGHGLALAGGAVPQALPRPAVGPPQSRTRHGDCRDRGPLLLDGLFNGMPNVIYIIAAGGLVNIVPVRTRPQVQTTHWPPTPGSAGGPIPGPGTLLERSRTARRGKDRLASCPRPLDQADGGRSVSPARRQQWCDCANDLAWLLVNAADPAVKTPPSPFRWPSRRPRRIPNAAPTGIPWGLFIIAPATSKPRSPPSIERWPSAEGARPSTTSFWPWLTRSSATKNKLSTGSPRRCSGWNNITLVMRNCGRLCDEARSILFAVPETSDTSLTPALRLHD